MIFEKHLRGVIHVEPSITTFDDHMSREKIRYEIKNKFIDFIKEI